MTNLHAVRMHGVLSPVVTPFDRELRPDGERLAKHCRWLLEQGVGLAVFGTNSEANSMSVAEKIVLLDTLVAGGIPPALPIVPSAPLYTNPFPSAALPAPPAPAISSQIQPRSPY